MVLFFVFFACKKDTNFIKIFKQTLLFLSFHLVIKERYSPLKHFSFFKLVLSLFLFEFAFFVLKKGNKHQILRNFRKISVLLEYFSKKITEKPKRKTRSEKGILGFYEKTKQSICFLC